MLVSEEYSEIYLKKQLFHLLFLVEVFNALENLTWNPKAFKEALLTDFFHETVIKR